MRRRGKILGRAMCWTIGALLGFGFSVARGDPDPKFYFAFWSGLMLAAIFIRFDPPEIETWERQA